MFSTFVVQECFGKWPWMVPLDVPILGLNSVLYKDYNSYVVLTHIHGYSPWTVARPCLETCLSFLEVFISRSIRIRTRKLLTIITGNLLFGKGPLSYRGSGQGQPFGRLSNLLARIDGNVIKVCFLGRLRRQLTSEPPWKVLNMKLAILPSPCGKAHLGSSTNRMFKAWAIISPFK